MVAVDPNSAHHLRVSFGASPSMYDKTIRPTHRSWVVGVVRICLTPINCYSSFNNWAVKLVPWSVNISRGMLCRANSLINYGGGGEFS